MPGKQLATGRRTASFRYQLATSSLILGDIAALVGALALTGSSGLLSWAYVALALFVLASASAYRRRMNLGALDEAPRFAMLAAIPLLILAPFSRDGSGRVMAQALASAGTIVLARAAVYQGLRFARRRGLSERTLIAGGGHVGIELAQLIRAHPEYGLDLVGFVGAPGADPVRRTS